MITNCVSRLKQLVKQSVGTDDDIYPVLRLRQNKHQSIHKMPHLTEYNCAELLSRTITQGNYSASDTFVVYCLLYERLGVTQGPLGQERIDSIIR